MAGNTMRGLNVVVWEGWFIGKTMDYTGSHAAPIQDER